MPLDVDVLIVGGSIAAVRCAESLRQNGFAGSLLLVSDEPEMPSDRPPLSKQFLAGDWDDDRVCLLTAGHAAELDIQLRLGSAATTLDPAAHTVTLADGETLHYRSVVIATGAAARPSPWGNPAGVHTLRSRADSERLKQSLTIEARVVVIGAGWIGAEVAATASRRGCRVTVVDVVANPYARSLGEELGTVLCGIHARHGVVARFSTGVADLTSNGREVEVTLADGSSLIADAVVVGIGAVPNTQWLVGSGVYVDDGVVCDEFGRGRTVEDVWAVGDVARWGDRRHEHWTSAVEQARAVGHNIASPHNLTASSGDGYMWSDQYTWKVQLAGDTGPHVACQIVGDVDQPRLAALYSDVDGLLVGIATVNWPKAFLAGRRALGTVDAAVHARELRETTANVPA